MSANLVDSQIDASAAAPASSLPKPPRVKPVAALLAITRLLRNPQDTRQVFLLTDALRGRSTVDTFLRFKGSATGIKVLSERRSLLATLSNHEWLASLPEGSLGRAYLRFMAAENLSAQGLVQVGGNDVLAFTSPDETVRVFAARMRDMHDLYHVLAGYGRDEIGEVCVLAFSYPQQKIRSFKVIATLGTLHIVRVLRRRGVSPRGTPAAVREAYRHGKQAAWLPGEDLEAMLLENLDELRTRLKIASPQAYEALINRVRAETGMPRGPLSVLKAG